MRRLRGRAGILVGTRPGVNLMLARLQAPGLTHDRARADEPQQAQTRRCAARCARYYPKLDALVVLTEQDREAYRELLERRRCRCTASPTPCGRCPAPRPTSTAKTVYAAGRFRYQKGFELLIPAWAETAKAHPDWRLRLRGRGHLESRYRGLIEQHGLEDSVTIEGPAEDIGADMAEARRCSCSPRASRASR